MRSSETTLNSSPGDGTSARPVISTGTDGPASLTCAPLSFVMTRTRPTAVPAMMRSDCRSVPFWTSSVAIGPRFLSSRASRTQPLPARFGLALSSSISAVRMTVSSSSSMPMPVFAEILQTSVSPPHSAGVRPCSVSWVRMRSGFAPCLSILLTATMMGILAALAWLMASMVCGMMPSSAATTRMAISVHIAPRARISVKAAWPGVSRKVMGWPLISTV